MNRTIHLLGVPSSAGAHWPGQEKAPAALREAGLPARLREQGVDLLDRGDLAPSRWRVERTLVNGHRVNNLAETVRVAERVAGEVRDVLLAGGLPLVIGGDCTITVGAVAGALDAGAEPALLYVDGGWDLGIPGTYPAGILDSMGSAHMLGLEGTTVLRDIGPRVPMLGPHQYIQFGHAPDHEGTPEHPIIASLGLPGVPAAEIRGRGAEAARGALARYLAEDQPFWLHFDVDVIDFFDLPVADVPIYDEAAPFADVIAAVGVFAGDRRCIGMTVTEFNPDHGHPDGREATSLATHLAGIFGPAA